ncbi:hypothetical protein QQF54_08540 [Lelliottia sp. V106_10]|uniref:hypothetical protein n=1 Tax=Lelliottia wanjuensis TaxID=3050585 RepID=UPI00254BCA13|nr:MULTISPECIES: hypothetical protein [unclassified Lelliottia]MDK9373401.1 hypothetical protein [Lelliottia sp. V106_10]MDK9600194.1 hypothetical protein [Lelliottia sp. V106_5]
MDTVKKPTVEHNPINVLLTIENGQVIHSRTIQSDEFVASFESWAWMAQRAGYKIIPPVKGEKNELNGDTDPSVDSPESN